MTKGTWEQTKLWSELKRRTDPEAKAAQTLLARWVPKIETILSSASTTPTDFTLHDANHSFHVAKRMVDVIPRDVLPKLSSYELALLLLSAYLHDIGMSPGQKRVKQHFCYLATGENSGLSAEEIASFQSWLDNNEEAVQPPICKGTPTAEMLQQVALLTAHFCRHQHNEWSGEWIRNHLGAEQLGSYSQWVNDLVTLCKSHHQGRLELEKAVFNPSWFGSDAQIVHLRYLACVLRLADILEFDPERTPDVIFQHRDISPGSIIYWHKDHDVSLKIENANLSVSARPHNAKAHQAIETMLNEIDQELQTCRWLADQTHFEICAGRKEQLPHRWDLQSSLFRDVKSKDGSYEFVNGAFRPNTSKLLQMLSGLELYSDRMAAIRELLQNAFDATREQIARIRLKKANPADRALEETLGNRYVVELKFEQRGDEFWLVCSDEGVGMTKAIINDYLLVSGQTRRHDLLALERQCEKAGFTTGRTGQFGIGVLSYFMLADRLVITTRRTIEAGSSEPNGWRFATEGVGAFGELRRDDSLTGGTKVELRLRRDLVQPDAAAFYANLTSYLRGTLQHIPCKLSLVSPVKGCAAFEFSYGWLKGTESVKEIFVANFVKEWQMDNRAELRLLPKQKQETRTNEEDNRAQCAQQFSKAIRWQVSVGDLPGGLGCFRVHMPYFQIGRSKLLLFIRKQGDNELQLIRKGFYYSPAAESCFSWKGMRCAAAQSSRVGYNGFHLGMDLGCSGSFCEVDFCSTAAGTLSVNRGFVELSPVAGEAVAWLKKHIITLVQAFLSRNCDSPYSAAENAKLRDIAPAAPRHKWAMIRPLAANYRTWRDIKFPATISFMWAYTDTSTVTWNGQHVDIIPALPSVEDEFSHYNGIGWADCRFLPDRVLHLSNYRKRVAPMWSRTPTMNSGFLETCSFPPNWTVIHGVTFTNYSKLNASCTIWNDATDFTKDLNHPAWERACGLYQHSNTDPLGFKEEILSAKAHAIAFLMCSAKYAHADIWKGLAERDSGFLLALWRLVFGKSHLDRTINLWIEDGSESRLRVLSHAGWTTIKSNSTEELLRYMPDVSPEWRLVDEVWEKEAVKMRRLSQMLKPAKALPRKARKKK